MIVGIDLGTTNSLVAVFKDGESQIIQNRLGERLTPSVVAVDEKGEVLIGRSAKEYSAIHPERSASVFKRFMGSEKEYHLGNHKFKSEDLSALILKSLKEDAEHFLGCEVEEAVISVPAYFDDDRRKATKLAGQLAGLKVERIISEPTAAAITYGLYDKSQSTRFLVFDLGGGTFDVSILELFDTILEVRAVAGDNYLGGEDFTAVIEDAILEKLELDKEKLDSKTLSLIYEAAEEMKLRLSDEAEATVKVPVGDEEKEFTMTSHEFEEACEPLLEKLRAPLQRSIADAHVRVSDIDEVVLVGGATRMPLIRNFIAKLFKKFPDTSVNPDEAIALGAAIQAAMKERNKEVKEVILTDVCGFTLGTEVTVDRYDGGQEAGHFSPIIERNTVIPASRTERYYTARENQDKVTINVYQGESRMVHNNLLLGELTVDVPAGPKGQEAVDVTFTYDINAILEVEVKVVSTGEMKSKIFKGRYNQMTDEEIEARMKELAYLKLGPRDQEENKLLLVRAERAYEECIGGDRTLIAQCVQAFEEALDSRDREKILDTRRALVEAINQTKW